MKRLYPWLLLYVVVSTVCELLFSHAARINMLVTALVTLALVAACALVTAAVRHLLPDGQWKAALLRLRGRRATVRPAPPAH